MKRVREFNCNKSSDFFCYICGKYTLIGDRRNINQRIRDLYKQYFKLDISNQDKCWVPHIACASCVSVLLKWTKGEANFSFGQPMIWRDPINHETNCYICLTNVSGYGRRNKHELNYANVDSVTLPVPHSNELPVPIFHPEDGRPDYSMLERDDLSDESDEAVDPLYIPDTDHPHMLSQGDLNDLVRDLNLTKQMSELLASRLQQWKLLQNNVRVTATRERSAHLAQWFAKSDKICYCKDIPQLFTAMNEHFDPDEWRLFIDGSKTSIKAVLLNAFFFLTHV